MYSTVKNQYTCIHFPYMSMLDKQNEVVIKDNKPIKIILTFGNKESIKGKC